MRKRLKRGKKGRHLFPGLFVVRGELGRGTEVKIGLFFIPLTLNTFTAIDNLGKQYYLVLGSWIANRGFKLNGSRMKT